jgi:integrase
LKILAGLVVPPGKRVRLPVVEKPELKPTVNAGQVTALYRELVDLAGSGPLEREGLGIKAQERSRLLALVSVVLDTGARVGELERMNVDDLAEDLSEVTVTRRPQNPGVGYEEVAYRLGVSRSSVARVAGGGTDPHVSEALRQEVLREVEAIRAEGPRVERYALREGTRVALRRWLAVREDLVAEVEGGRSGLWVTVFPSKAGPPGVRIRAQGLGQSYARGVTAINFVMAGQPGWEPLPVRMEQLRRSVDVEPLEDEAGQ